MILFLYCVNLTKKRKEKILQNKKRSTTSATLSYPQHINASFST